MILFAVIYNIITAFLLTDMLNNQSGSLGYVLILFPTFWVISGIILFIIKKRKIVDFKGIINKIFLFFSTPLALILSYYIYIQLSDAKYVVMTAEYDKGNFRYREVTYDYDVAGPTQRKEFYILKNDWIKDSIWTYYHKDGSIKKTEDYRKTDNSNY